MNDLFKSYFDSMPCYITVQDRDFHVVQANRLFRDDFGEVEGRFCYQVYKHRSEKCEICPVEKTFRDGRSNQSREIVRTLGGREVSVLVNTTPITNDRGEITAVLEMSTDVTDLSVLEQQLRDSQNRYRLLFEEVPCFISIQDRNLRIVEANRLHRETFETRFGDKCYKVYKHREEACYPCIVQQTFEDGKVHLHEEVVTPASGNPINVMVTTAPLRGRGGEIELVMEMSADITQVRQLQSQLSSIGLIISSISHDLKGFLSGLDGGIYLVNSGLSKDDRKRIETGWEMVMRNVGHVRRTVLDILYFSKDRQPELAPVDTVGLVKEVAEQSVSKAKELGINMNLDVEPSAGIIQADARALRSMLANLIENALDACRLDSRQNHHQVDIHLTGNTHSVQIDVVDNGIGMPQEVREKAFSLFFSSKGSGGTGLGLYIANRIVGAHGGKIELGSEVGKGSRFRVVLPRQPLMPQRDGKD
ncbi:MAG: PAS domain-containing sensor histidine kinase [Candidatus Zixiibacteriota bacterium]